MIILPAPIGEPDLRAYDGPNRAAREFVRFVGVAEARDSLAREARRHGG